MTDFLGDFYSLFRANYSIASRNSELTPVLVKAGLAKALLRFSKYQPRENQRKNIDIISGSSAVDLPANFMKAKVSELYRLKTGNTICGQAYDRIWLGWFTPQNYYISINGRFNANGDVLNYRYGNQQTQAIQLTTGDTRLYSLWLDTDSAEARTCSNFSYTALQEITTSKNTVPVEYEDILLDLTMKESLLVLQRQYIEAGKTAEANQIATQAKSYGNSIGQIAILEDGA